MKFWHKKILTYGIVGGGLLLAFAVGFGISSLIPHVSKQITLVPVHDPENGYSFINPILYTEVPESLSFPRLIALKSAISSYVSSAIANHKATNISVYFRDFNQVNWIGVNIADQYDPASMLKVATLIGVLHTSENFPPLLSGKITMTPSLINPVSEQDFYPPARPAQAGHTYTVEDLLQKMITESDNDSNSLLIKYIGVDTFTQVFSDLNVPIPSTTNGVTIQEYSHFFRVLYNATYLTLPDSEKALQLLSQTTFTQGLVAGVPSGTVVSHKFGEKTSSDTALSPDAPLVRELHDCGIVYYPNHPYIICVMTRGSDFPTLASIISDISRITWTQMKALNN